jgi:hypothetical protein
MFLSTVFPVCRQETAHALQMLPDFSGSRRPPAWRLLLRNLHPEIHTEIFQRLG